ncbi:uncharacterized protein B0H64DRAFT_193049 [Chaetomium fimeti]|uniref:Uncharacterized protein n=1 Tax=Chaetomium fimeti TaxID=1854472 RepID=A0AAE0LRL0_9PEZI|nr:hypothetical protein B0H64DRAFT_193049 [Chaetomium fimeti]
MPCSQKRSSAGGTAVVPTLPCPLACPCPVLPWAVLFPEEACCSRPAARCGVVVGSGLCSHGLLRWGHGYIRRMYVCTYVVWRWEGGERGRDPGVRDSCVRITIVGTVCMYVRLPGCRSFGGARLGDGRLPLLLLLLLLLLSLLLAVAAVVAAACACCSGRAIGVSKLRGLDGRGGRTGGVTEAKDREEGWTDRGGRGGRPVWATSVGDLSSSTASFFLLTGLAGPA